MKINKKIKFSYLTLVACTVIAGIPFAANAEAFTAEQKTELNKLFEAFLMEHPDVLLKAVEKYRQDQEVKTAQDAQANLSKHKDNLYSKDNPSTGNPDGDVTIVEYFDYNCGYCKRFYADMLKLLEEDKNVRVVFKELPILSPASDMMARYALAAHMQGKYFDMHKALMEHKGDQTEEAFLEEAKKAGLDIEKLKADKAKPKVEEILSKDMQSAKDLGIQGTPGLVIGDQIYRGYIGLDGIKQSIKEIRAKNKPAE